MRTSRNDKFFMLAQLLHKFCSLQFIQLFQSYTSRSYDAINISLILQSNINYRSLRPIITSSLNISSFQHLFCHFPTINIHFISSQTEILRSSVPGTYSTFCHDFVIVPPAHTQPYNFNITLVPPLSLYLSFSISPVFFVFTFYCPLQFPSLLFAVLSASLITLFLISHLLNISLLKYLSVPTFFYIHSLVWSFH